MRFHIYGQDSFVELPVTTTVQDLRTLAWFNKIIKNYFKMQKFAKKNRYLNMTLEEIKKNCKPGWHLNPNEKVVNGILKGINRNEGDCPCNNDSEDKKCSCSNYRLKDKCCCGLYIKD